MSDLVRIPLRLVGLVLFLASVAAVVFITVLGPDEVAGHMGKNCRHNDQLGPSQYCTWQDVLSVMEATSTARATRRSRPCR